MPSDDPIDSNLAADYMHKLIYAISNPRISYMQRSLLMESNKKAECRILSAALHV